MTRLRAGQSGLRTIPFVQRILGWAASGLLVIDGYVHAHDAGIYDANSSSVLSQGTLFRLEAAAAVLVAVALAGWPRRAVWTAALLTASSAAAAALLYRYVDVGQLGPLPNMYEPTWATPGKLLSVYAEGAAAALSVGALLLRARSAAPLFRRPVGTSLSTRGSAREGA